MIPPSDPLMKAGLYAAGFGVGAMGLTQSYTLFLSPREILPQIGKQSLTIRRALHCWLVAAVTKLPGQIYYFTLSQLLLSVILSLAD